MGFKFFSTRPKRKFLLFVLQEEMKVLRLSLLLFILQLTVWQGKSAFFDEGGKKKSSWKEKLKESKMGKWAAKAGNKLGLALGVKLKRKLS